MKGHGFITDMFHVKHVQKLHNHKPIHITKYTKVIKS